MKHRGPGTATALALLSGDGASDVVYLDVT